MTQTEYEKLMAELRALHLQVRELEKQMKRLKAALSVEGVLRVDYTQL